MKANPLHLPNGTYPATVKSGKFSRHRLERGREGVELVLDVAGDAGLVYEIVHFADLNSLDGLSHTFAAGADFLTTLDPAELAGLRCMAVVGRRLWKPGRPWVEAVTVLPATTKSIFIDNALSVAK